MKTIYNKYIRNNWYWINREPIFIITLILIALYAILNLLLILIDKI